eukprot:COSAG01_NODE_7155_length_3327_cov_2.644052_3_plen_107_part_00
MVMITMAAQAFNDTLAAFDRAFRHNSMAAPSFIATEAARYYLPARMDGREACSATGDGTHEPGSPVIPRCCQVMIWWPHPLPHKRGLSRATLFGVTWKLTRYLTHT